MEKFTGAGEEKYRPVIGSANAENSRLRFREGISRFGNARMRRRAGKHSDTPSNILNELPRWLTVNLLPTCYWRGNIGR